MSDTHVHPTQDDGVVAALSEVVGGPVGEHAGPTRGAISVVGVLLAMTALTFALGLVSKTACAHHGWSTTDQTRFTHACASDVPDAYSGLGLDELAWPWSGEQQTRLRYPVTEEPAGVGLWQYAAARVTFLLTGSPDVHQRYGESASTLAATSDVKHERRVFVAVNAFGFAVLALLSTLALVRARRRRPWDAAVFAAAPVLVLAGVVSWDLLPVAAVAGALWAWSSRRPVLAGVLLGAGMATGVWPVLVLGALAVVAVRRRRAATVLPTVVTSVAVWALLNAPAYLSGRAQWEHFWSAAWHRGADQGTIWTIVAQSVGLTRSAGHQASVVLLVLWVVAIVAVSLLAPAPPRASQVALMLVVGFLLLGLTYEPEQALWLLPLAALARPRWRDVLVWQACEVVYFAMYWWWRGGLLDNSNDKAAGFYWIAIGIHVVGVVWLFAMVVRDVWWPEDDVVRRDEGQLTTTRSNAVAV